MTPVVSVHFADVGLAAWGRLMAHRWPTSVIGLRHADAGLAARLGGATLTKPQPSRIGVVAFWDDVAALDEFESFHPVAELLSGGWSARLEPLRRFGSWPGLPEGLPTARATGHVGPAVAITFGRLRVSQTVRFLRTSAKAESAFTEASGVRWATSVLRPPFVATVSIWDSTKSLMTYAYGTRDRRHPDAIDVDVAKTFHKREAFVRFRAIEVRGELTGRNPMPFAVID